MALVYCTPTAPAERAVDLSVLAREHWTTGEDRSVPPNVPSSFSCLDLLNDTLVSDTPHVFGHEKVGTTLSLHPVRREEISTVDQPPPSGLRSVTRDRSGGELYRRWLRRMKGGVGGPRSEAPHRRTCPGGSPRQATGW